jgi:DNA repair protein RecO (recombination protein O)
MSRDKKYKAIILKKQPYGEGDEIITFFTKENGKLRVLAKSTKFAKSKLQYSLQTLFLVDLTIAGSSSLPKVIGAEVKNTFANIRENFEAAKAAFFALEVLIKFTPDEQKNEQLFGLFLDFFEFLNKAEIESNLFQNGFAKFKIEFLEALGLGITSPAISLSVMPSAVGFSNSRGGFILDENIVDFIPIKKETYDNFSALKEIPLKEIASNTALEVQELNDLLNSFLRYQLERDIKSERFLDM